MKTNEVSKNRLKASELKEAKLYLLEEQNYVCPLCDIDLSDFDDKNLHLDHCHYNGWLRAVLCSNCNRMEGRIRRLANRAKRGMTIEAWLKRLMGYWDQHSTNEDPIYHPRHRTEDEKRIRRNKRARKRAKQRKMAKQV